MDCTAEPINKMPLKSGKSGDDWTALQKTHVLFNTMFSFVILLLDRNKQIVSSIIIQSKMTIEISVYSSNNSIQGNTTLKTILFL